MLTALLIAENTQGAELLCVALHDAGYRVVREQRARDLMNQVRGVAPDVVVIDCEAPDDAVLEQIAGVTREAPRPIVLFTEDGDRSRIQAAVRAGISAYIVGGLTATRIRPILDVAMARFNEFQALRQELTKAKLSLSERKQIERAKGIVMKSRGVSEEEAYVLLRTLAMERNQRLAQVAENIIAMAELLIKV